MVARFNGRIADGTCQRGRCQRSCPTGLTLCGGRCVSLQTDRKNCGYCGNACGFGRICEAGGCRGETGTNCTSDLDCLQGRGLICTQVSGCGYRPRQCCAVTGRTCTNDCDCCGTGTCQYGVCKSPENREFCRPGSEYTVPCPDGGCCQPQYPNCTQYDGCCAKGYPKYCPLTESCCAEGTYCCQTGCCVATSASASREVIVEPGIPAVRKGSKATT
jgi:hypothetical protein